MLITFFSIHVCFQNFLPKYTSFCYLILNLSFFYFRFAVTLDFQEPLCGNFIIVLFCLKLTSMKTKQFKKGLITKICLKLKITYLFMPNSVKIVTDFT